MTTELDGNSSASSQELDRSRLLANGFAKNLMSATIIQCTVRINVTCWARPHEYRQDAKFKEQILVIVRIARGLELQASRRSPVEWSHS